MVEDDLCGHATLASAYALSLRASQANVDCEALMAYWLFTTERNHAPGMLHFEIARTATSEQLPGTAFSTVVVSMAWK